MSHRLAIATLLAVGSFSVVAQPIHPNIQVRLDGCFGQHQNNPAANRSCIGRAWDESLKQVSQQVGQKAGDQGYQKCQASLQPQITNLQQQLGKAQSDCNAQIKVITSKQPDLQASIDSAVLADRAARRASGSAAIDQFLSTFELNAKSMGRDLDFVSVNYGAGTILLRRQGEPAVLLAFPSLARAFLQEKDTELRFECAAQSGQCISMVSKDGVLSKYGSVWFPVSTTQTDTLVQRATAAVQAFR
jgi:hypothetical protein